MGKGIFAGLMDLLFPPRCTFCRRLLGRGERWLCGDCERSLPYTKNARRSGEDFSICVYPLYYEGAVRDAVLRYKFKGASNYAGGFGKLLADCIREELAGQYDLITWVPLSARRQKTRGYDQAFLLATAAALELDDVAVETLRKRRDTPAQSGLKESDERRTNVFEAYEVRDPELIQGKRILLIDDVVTTGATLGECARTLRGAGASRVLCAALAGAGRDRDGTKVKGMSQRH